MANRAVLLLGVLSVVGSWSCSSETGEEPWQPGTPLTLQVGSTFPAGTVLRDAYTGQTATVAAGGSVTVGPGAGGVVLLERDGAQPTPFTWANATVYFAVTDRFENGDPGNDGSYGRRKDGASEVGTWHGGDWKGLAARLDHLAALGVDAVWISPIVEQVHGWVGGGSGDFPHYAYAGYWALDFTRLDANFGTQAELQDLVDQAHQRGIRVLVDVVMNHPGYATGDDLVAYLPEVIDAAAFASFQPSGSRGWHAWNDLVNYQHVAWSQWWWGVDWVRASGIRDYGPGGADDLTRQLSFLPDFRTEATGVPGPPPLFQRKTDTGVVDGSGFTVRDYLVTWHAGWVASLGVDGFRCDTAKNVELASWQALKDAGVAALRDWKARNPGKKPDDADFWTVGEVFGHGVAKDAYYTEGGFDALLNFSFQPALLSLLQTRPSLAAGATELDAIYASYARAVADPAVGVVSYLSSHDTSLFFDSVGQDVAKQKQAATALLLAPGAVQVFYGDESGRRPGPALSDPLQGTRSDMNWTSIDAGLLAHWQRLGAFRRSHAAVGAGAHERLASPPGTYAFARRLGAGGAGDAVVVAVTPLP
jgi:alpha-amylase